VGADFWITEAETRIEKAYELLEPCRLCPRNCEVNRLAGKKGFCGTGEKVLVSSYGPHFGEEPPLVGAHGSGTIFLGGCNLGCIFCQNYDISHHRIGTPADPEDVAEIMLHLERNGCHNINLVTPTHFTPQLMKAIGAARRQGLSIPLVYNCGGYESIQTLRLLEGFIAIYMPDMKYADEAAAEKLSSAADYPSVSKNAVLEMHRQVGDLVIDDAGIAERGLLVRHLVMPNGLAGSEKILSFLAGRVSRSTYVNIMDQYRPVFRAFDHPELNRRITWNEYDEVLAHARKLGLHRGF
jgi:putative pyruvate formate lyase activating enzyme